MPRTRSKKPIHLEVTGLEALPSTMVEWERALITSRFTRDATHAS